MTTDVANKAKTKRGVLSDLNFFRKKKEARAYFAGPERTPLVETELSLASDPFIERLLALEESLTRLEALIERQHS